MSTNPSQNNPPAKGFSVLSIFNYIGGALIIFGIGFFISVNWSTLNDFTKVFSTLGAAIAAYFVALLFHLDKRYEAASSAFFLISGLVLPIGLLVTFKVFSHNVVIDLEKVNLIVLGICAAVFLLSHLIMPRTIFLFFSVYYASSFYLILIDIISHQGNYVFPHLFEYQFIALGLSYILLGRYLDFENRFSGLIGPLYFFGCLFILSASYSLGGSFFLGSGMSLWKVITGLLIFFSFFLAIPLKSKSFLYLGAIFLVIYLIDISSKFANIFGNFGWPLILIAVGFLLMIVGYLVFNIHKKIAER